LALVGVGIIGLWRGLSLRRLWSVGGGMWRCPRGLLERASRLGELTLNIACIFIHVISLFFFDVSSGVGGVFMTRISS
jgi:hypothetical protein